jgi:hypothetical protein
MNQEQDPPPRPNDHFELEIDERLRSVKNANQRRTITKLLSEISHLPLDHTRAALETSAAIAGVSLRASIEFLRAAPAVSQVLDPAELRAWGEIGRRLTMADIDAGVGFFTAGVSEFRSVPPAVRPFVLQVCSRQTILSAAVAAETFQKAPHLASVVRDAEILRAIYEISATISRRSAKQSIV